VARRQWHDLSVGQRRFFIIGAAVEGALKMAALADLRRRPADQVRGSKRVWALAITFINAFGAVPVLYFAFGRQPAPDVFTDYPTEEQLEDAA
jgi:hypothetical protein